MNNYLDMVIFSYSNIYIYGISKLVLLNYMFIVLKYFWSFNVVISIPTIKETYKLMDGLKCDVICCAHKMGP